ncbi:MAG: hypothetical protein ABI467_11525 [Kofleriaceae bacterium]
MERTWLPTVIIGGGAIVLVGGFVLLGGGASSGPPERGSPSVAVSDASIEGASDAQMIESSASVASSAMPSPPPSALDLPATTASEGAVPDPSTDSALALGEGPPGVRIRGRIAQLKKEISQLDSEGKHEQAAQKMAVLRRLQARLAIVQNGL